MLYKYFTVTPDYKVQEQTADDMEVVADHAQIVCGTNDKLEYKDYTIYFNNTKVGSANFAVGDIGAYGTLVFCIGEDSDDVWMITQHFKSLESDEEYKGLFSKENASGLTTLEDFYSIVVLFIGKEVERKPPKRKKSFAEMRLEEFSTLALLIRRWLRERNLLKGSCIVVGGQGYLRLDSDEKYLSFYQQEDSVDEPQEIGMILGLSKQAADMAGYDLSNIDGLDLQQTNGKIVRKALTETTWAFYDLYNYEM